MPKDPPNQKLEALSCDIIVFERPFSGRFVALNQKTFDAPPVLVCKGEFSAEDALLIHKEFVAVKKPSGFLNEEDFQPLFGGEVGKPVREWAWLDNKWLRENSGAIIDAAIEAAIKSRDVIELKRRAGDEKPRPW